jgi:hypothetical protein
MGNEDAVEEDLDDIDFGNYKGIYFGDDANKKYTCPDSGAHFKFSDMCQRMIKIHEKRQAYEKYID